MTTNLPRSSGLSTWHGMHASESREKTRSTSDGSLENLTFPLWSRIITVSTWVSIANELTMSRINVRSLSIIWRSSA